MKVIELKDVKKSYGKQESRVFLSLPSCFLFKRYYNAYS